MESKRVTIKDVARYSGVSIATVSLILNGNENKFSRKTVEKVLEAKEVLDYQPNYFAQQMIIKKSKTIGVMMSDITNPFFGQLISGIEKALYQENFVTILCNANFDEGKEKYYLEELMRRGVDGFIIATSAISNETLYEMLEKRKRPYINIDQKRIEGLSDAVLSDDFKGGQLAAQHLLKLGHKDLVIVMPIDAPEHIQNRLRGFKKACDDQSATSITIIDAKMSKDGGRKAVEQIVQTRATGIFTINDEMAFGLYRGMEDAGKEIPNDYSVIGYDNVEMCEYITPRLTTVAQSIPAIGETTAKILMERINNPDKPAEEVILPVALVERSSTAPLT
ncbi:LacI family DNA-binding transcriptional regulator [Enterococcus sp. 669A]|uniref:LacI family DNA-binding transcriptional regulator n=1 Tax=Candidatus Enterococcus moelleringii TaxID=2815325 RepID=A0ABS3L9A0_9ENTE|nr:LacI family DNA-binding transcriptional regulator [Enterococcus sp. 669A]MBO1306208.1 LacI family DNA-binding transcriptional regulator [Enterococcus sp. 669A]